MDPYDHLAPAGKPWQLSVRTYHRMIEAGIFGEDDHLELIEGVLIEMTPQGPPHAGAVQRLTSLLVKGVGEEFAVRVQLPITLGDKSEPEPDFAVVPASADPTQSHPQTAPLVIEVANTSVRFDRAVKAAVYAKANIPEYWILNVAERAIEVFRDPDPQTGRYLSLRTVKGSDQIQPKLLPGPVITPDALFR
ncbi:MAG: Uma2 family endonuclease [Myxococcaceae bacterium]